MLANALDQLVPDDVLLLDRGYPAAWLIHMLNQRGIRFIMRCDTTSSGWRALREFMRGDLAEAVLQLSTPKPRDPAAWDYPAKAPAVRLVRNTATGASLRVLQTNPPAVLVPAEAFGHRNHQRRRIEEAFKSPKHRLHLEAVSGLVPHALLEDACRRQGARRKYRGNDVPGPPRTTPTADQPRRARTRADAAALCPRSAGRGDVFGLINDTLKLIA